MQVHVHLLPKLCQPTEFAGGVTVVIDILRASTTMIMALANGANAIEPVGEIEDAIRRRVDDPTGRAILAGERGGRKVDGFELGNSPAEFDRPRMADRRLIFTTSNGTRALLHAAASARLVVGAFANLNALISLLKADGRPVHLLCAGTDGVISAEDVLFAGAVAAALLDSTEGQPPCSDETWLAIQSWAAVRDSWTAYRNVLCRSRGGQNLIEIGAATDIDWVAEWDRTPIIPERQSDGTLRPAPAGPVRKWLSAPVRL